MHKENMSAKLPCNPLKVRGGVLEYNEILKKYKRKGEKMHRYLKSIGFSKYNTKKSILDLQDEVVRYPSRTNTYLIDNNEYVFCYEKDYGETYGLAVLKIGKNKEEAILDSFYPYVKGFNYLINDNYEIEQSSDHEGYYSICDENNLGIPLIFFINNPLNYKNIQNKYWKETINCTTLSALAVDGIVLLPIEKDDYQLQLERKGNEKRNRMITMAKAGDVEAMERLTLQDMDMYTNVSIRSRREDIFTIVSSYFMPYTVECDKYAIMGDILDVTEYKNKKTKELLYSISVECNSIEIDVIINQKDIIGVPEKGRRFKGHIWLQGELDCV